jgi:methylated-DNA-[protein]-cysteine S-methyltransferase
VGREIFVKVSVAKALLPIVGRVTVAVTTRGVVAVVFGDTLPVRTRQRIQRYAGPCEFKQVRWRGLGVTREIERYVSGKLRHFNSKPLLMGTKFQLKVWNRAMTVPYGKVVSYRDLARMIRMPSATRAVGNALGTNPVPLIVPCHRIIASDGSIGGFGSGPALKEKLLELEGIAWV